MWTCKCGYANNRNTDVYCGNCGKEKFIPQIQKCQRDCRPGGFVQDPNDFTGMTYLLCGRRRYSGCWCGRRCRPGGFIRDPNDFTGMTYIPCPIRGVSDCGYP
jgi:hypothetical protein